MENQISIKKLYFIVFLTGAVVMILELAGSRILAPSLGTSIFVWTSLIGIILGAMSMGYYLGGKFADKNPNAKTFSNIILLSGIFVFIIIIIKKSVLEASVLLGMELGSVFAAMALFAIPGILLGAVSPYSVRLAMKNINNSGKTVGNLYAVSTSGSIAGTFTAGFYFIPNFGSINILYGAAISLFFISMIAYGGRSRNIQAASILILLFGYSTVINAMEKSVFLVDEDSEYNHIQVYDKIDREGKDVRIMNVENFYDSGMYLDSDDLVFDYTKYYRLDNVFNNDISGAVMFGGAAYSVPKDFLRRNKEGMIDVVEIDPRTTEIAKKYFRLDDKNKRLRIYHQDARIFLNESVEKRKGGYDAVYNDAFSNACSVPFQLTTKEAIEKIYGILNEDGVYIMNLISSISGEKSYFLRAEYKTIQEIFPSVFVFPVTSINKEDYDKAQNIMLIATKKKTDINKIIKNNYDEMKKLLSHYLVKGVDTDDTIILTDDFAPVNYYALKLCK